MRSFYELATFYKRFIQNFSTIMAPVTNCLKQREFDWSKPAVEAFQNINQRMTEVHVMHLSNFSKVFLKLHVTPLVLVHEVFWVKRVTMLSTSVKNWMIFDNVTPLMIRNSMRMFNLRVIGAIIYYHGNLLSIRTIKPSDTSTPKRD